MRTLPTRVARLATIALVIVAPATAAAQRATVDEERRKTAALIEEYSADVGESMTLPQLLEYAAKHAPTVREADASIALGDAAVRGARKFQPFNPEFEGELGLGLEDVGLDRLEVRVAQRLEIAGQRGLRVTAAELRREALEAERARASWDVHERVHGLFRLGLVARRRVAVERDTLVFTEELFEITKARYEAGEEPRTSVIVSKAELAAARQRLVQAWTRYVRTLGDLGTAVGWKVDAPPQPTGDLAPARPAPRRELLVEKALTEDPQLSVLEARLAQASAELDLHRREVWPSPRFGVGWERESEGPAGANTLLLVVGVPLPIWNRNRGVIAADEARIALIQQQIASRRAVLKNEVSAQAEAVNSAQRQAAIFEGEVLPALETQLELLREGFELGELSLLDVMNARDRLLAVQRKYLEALEKYYVAVSELERLLGTSIWEESERGEP